MIEFILNWCESKSFDSPIISMAFKRQTLSCNDRMDGENLEVDCH